ncbi:hypothetical protein Pelo_16665 [Pelomyxa schiedti]|nr:hypothetical protein Pelo_16665 [Pelomyxa schiedti]
MMEKITCRDVRNGFFVMLKGHLCQVTSCTNATRTGGARASRMFRLPVGIEGVDLMDGQHTYKENHTATYQLDALPRIEEDLIDVDVERKMCTIVTDKCNVKQVGLPEGQVGEDIIKEFAEGHNVIVICQKPLGYRHIISFRMPTE